MTKEELFLKKLFRCWIRCCSSCSRNSQISTG